MRKKGVPKTKSRICIVEEDDLHYFRIGGAS